MIVHSLFLFFPVRLLNIPTLPFLIAILFSTLIALNFNYYSYWLGWLKCGKVNIFWWTLGGLVSIGSVCALISWAFWTNNLGAGTEFMKFSEFYSLPIVVLFFIPLFAIVNAFQEEFIYRGILQSGLEKIFYKNYILAIFLSSTAFAAAHVSYGFPNGKIGYVMTLVYGIFLGIMRIKTQGILLPYVVHVVADLTIGYVLLYLTIK
jgi:membrane protease YdiL (CAAX protease family)